MADGGSATIGAENLTGSAGTQLSRNTTGSVAPATSTSFTP
jgi:hypothetical protein